METLSGGGIPHQNVDVLALCLSTLAVTIG